MSWLGRVKMNRQSPAAEDISKQFLAVAAEAFAADVLPLAVKAARLAVDFHPSRKALSALADYVAASGDPHESIRIYERLVAEHRVPMDARIALSLGVMEAWRGNFDEALNHLWRVAALGEGNDELFFYIGSCYAMRRQFAAANHIFRRNLALQLPDGRATSTAQLRLPDRRESIPKVADIALPFVRVFSLERDTVVADARVSTSDIVHLIACDSGYFRLFSRPLVRSVAERAGVAATLHFHICNAEPEDLRQLEGVARDYPVPVVCTTERVDFRSMTPEQIKTYLTCSRFLLLPELQVHYDKTILVTDADQMIVKPIAGLIEAAQSHDVGLLLFSKASINTLALISASVCIAGRSAKSRLFFEAVRDYIRERMTDPAAIAWHLDQAALAATYLSSGDIDFYLMSPKTMISQILKPAPANDTEEPLFWSATYSIKANARKLDAAEYRTMAS